ncbi:PREDICTED: carboxylesterase 1-like [Fragaria vesca subsp. vesca]
MSNTDQFKPKIISNPDGTYTRLIKFPSTDADSTSATNPVLSKDIPVNPKTQTMVRFFLPRNVLGSKTKLPLIFYYHGGAFLYCSATTTVFHEFCSNMASELQAIVVSVDYRLAPEHRLPAAYEDAVDVLYWIKTAEEVWVREFADFSSCFLMGTSSGGNLAYHAGLLAGEVSDQLRHLKIKGLILHHPFFGGSERTESELKMEHDRVLPLRASDAAWKLVLPIGADRDHEYCNPMVVDRNDAWGAMRAVDCRVLVLGCYGDPMIDRQMGLARMVEEKGVQTATHFGDGCHGLEITDPSKAPGLFAVLKNFIY